MTEPVNPNQPPGPYVGDQPPWPGQPPYAPPVPPQPYPQPYPTAMPPGYPYVTTTSNTFQPHVTKVKEERQTSHTFHLLMTLLTCGLWALCVWLPITIWHKWGLRRTIVERHY